MKISRADEGALQFQLIKRNRTIVLVCNILTWNGGVKLISRTAIWTVCVLSTMHANFCPWKQLKKTKEIKKTENCTKNRERKREERKPAISHTRKITSLKFVFFSSRGRCQKGKENKRKRDLRWQHITPWLVDKYIYVEVDKLLTKHATKNYIGVWYLDIYDQLYFL